MGRHPVLIKGIGIWLWADRLGSECWGAVSSFRIPLVFLDTSRRGSESINGGHSRGLSLTHWTGEKEGVPPPAVPQVGPMGLW